MEDSACAVDLGYGRTFFGVFDGHAGALCAKIVAEALPSVVAIELDRGPDEISALNRAMKSMDVLLKKAVELFNDRSGCTASCVLATPTDLFVVNLGDTRTLVVDRGTLVFASVDHGTENLEERKRVMRAGGFL